MTGGDWPMTGLDWRPLAETDPVPGDPERVRELAARYARAASFAGEQASAVRRVEQAAHGDGAARWDGVAAEAFRARVGELPRDLDQVAARHQRVAMALLDFAPALESAQRGARLALTRARDAQVRAGVSPSSPVTSLPVLLPSVQSAAERAMCTEVAQARRLLAAAVEQHVRAADQCTRALRAAGDDRLRNPHGWRRVLRAVSALAGRVSTWLGVAAVLLCPVPGLGEVLGAVALTAGGVALLADLARPATATRAGRRSRWMRWACCRPGGPCGSARCCRARRPRRGPSSRPRRTRTRVR